MQMLRRLGGGGLSPPKPPRKLRLCRQTNGRTDGQTYRTTAKTALTHSVAWRKKTRNFSVASRCWPTGYSSCYLYTNTKAQCLYVCLFVCLFVTNKLDCLTVHPTYNTVLCRAWLRSLALVYDMATHNNTHSDSTWSPECFGSQSSSSSSSSSTLFQAARPISQYIHK